MKSNVSFENTSFKPQKYQVKEKIMTTTYPDQQRINQLREQLAQEEAQLNEFNQMTEAQQLAVELHDRTCTLPHEDMCAWEYETRWSKSRGWTHDHYQEKAEKMLAMTTRENISEIITIIKSL